MKQPNVYEIGKRKRRSLLVCQTLSKNKETLSEKMKEGMKSGSKPGEKKGKEGAKKLGEKGAPGKKGQKGKRRKGKKGILVPRVTERRFGWRVVSNI